MHTPQTVSRAENPVMAKSKIQALYAQATTTSSQKEPFKEPQYEST